jgi:hypothetical protein
MTDQNYPIRLVHSVCCLAGDPEFVDHRRASGKNSLAAAIERHDTARLFEWLVEALSYQGIADRIAYDYMQRHGGARWARISASLARNPSCPKLGGYWRFYDCRYRKGSRTCSEPAHMDACPRFGRVRSRRGHGSPASRKVRPQGNEKSQPETEDAAGKICPVTSSRQSGELAAVLCSVPSCAFPRCLRYAPATSSVAHLLRSKKARVALATPASLSPYDEAG